MILAAATAAVLGLGLQARTEDGRPYAYQSVLLVTGLLLLYAALLRLADVLGADFGGGDGDSPVWAALAGRHDDVDVAGAGGRRRLGRRGRGAPRPRC